MELFSFVGEGSSGHYNDTEWLAERTVWAMRNINIPSINNMAGVSLPGEYREIRGADPV